MKRVIAGITVVLLCLCCIPTHGAQLSDPYEILNKYYDAIGGLDKIKSHKTSYAEGTIAITNAGISGTFKNWTQQPNLSRQEVDLKVITQISGDNGTVAWSVDTNGRLQIIRDEESLKRRELSILTGEYDFLDRNSKTFTLTFEGVEPVDGVDCYVVKTSNTINDDVSYQYIATDSFLLLKVVSKQPDTETTTMNYDYREVDGVKVSFKQTATVMPTGMVQQIELTKLENNIEIDPALFEPPGESARDFTFTDGFKAENIPFKFIEKHIYLPVTVGGYTRLWVLDTGASMTVIMKEFAEELGLEGEGNLKGQGAGNLVDVAFVDLPPFALKGIEFESQKVALIDINDLFRKTMGFEIAGILGFDFLSRLVVKVDYANQTLSFYDPEHFAYDGPGTIIEAPLNDTRFELPLSVDGTYSGKWNLDLGASGMSFHYPYAEEHNFLKLPGTDHVSFGAGGQSKSHAARFKSIEFAGYTIKDPIISMPYEDRGGAFSGRELIGNIGNTLLRHFTLILDYGHERVIVEKGDDFDKVFPRDGSGLQVINNDDKQIEVLFVSPGAPADKAGIKAGDILTAINHIPVEVIDGPVAIRKLLMAAPGTQYTLTLTREGASKDYKLTLRDLYK